MSQHVINYMVSKRLKDPNSQLIDYFGKEAIPMDVIAKEFQELLQSVSDEEAQLLIDQPSLYLTHTSPISVLPVTDGVNVHGEIPDNVLSILEKLNGTTANQIITEHIQYAIKILNPDSKVDIKELTLGDKVQALKERVDLHKVSLESISPINNDVTNASIDDITDIKVVETTSSVEQIKTEDIVEQVTLSDDSEKQVKKILANTYNQFIKLLHTQDISNRIDLDEPLQVAIIQ